MGVDVKNLGADDSDEQQREPKFARDWPTMIEPEG
jgi:hypothetical protein